MIRAKVRERTISVSALSPVTTGSENLQVSWHFDETWDELTKIAVFRVGDTADVPVEDDYTASLSYAAGDYLFVGRQFYKALSAIASGGTIIPPQDDEQSELVPNVKEAAFDMAVLGNLCVIPVQLLEQDNAGENLWIGVYGRDLYGNTAVPTIWTYTRIYDGTNPQTVDPAEPTPEWPQQVQEYAEEAASIARQVREDADAGVFDGISPEVTISEISHGHSVTITDREHPEGQSFPVLDGASAYEQAVAGGYEGTEAQFNQELRSFKTFHDETQEAAPFYAVYGQTTKGEIAAAKNGKRQIFLQTASFGGTIVPYAGSFAYVDTWDEGTGYRFMLTEGTVQHVFELKSSWSSYTNDLAAPAQRAETAADDAEAAQAAAERSAAAAEESARNAAANAGYMFFHIDANGHLIYERSSNVEADFGLVDGHLYLLEESA